MLRVFNLFFSQIHLLLFLILILSVNKSYGKDDLNDIDPMTLFHESEEVVKVQDEFLKEVKDGTLRFQIYYLNQNEPYNNPIAIKAFFQCEKGEAFVRLDRQLEGELKTYCQYGEPEVVSEASFLTSPGEHLVLPVYSFSDEKGECDLDEVKLEVYPVQGLQQYCSKEEQ